MGLGTAGARINAVGTVVGTDAPAMTFSNTGAIVMSVVGARTLTLGGATLADNTFRPQITDGGGATSLTKLDAWFFWLINPDVAGNTYTGGTTISGGTLAIQAGSARAPASSTSTAAGALGLQTAARASPWPMPSPTPWQKAASARAAAGPIF